jgi:hypothetical protein
MKKEKLLIINGKPVVKRLGNWAQMKSSSGKTYYFHLAKQARKTTISHHLQCYLNL